MPQPWCARCCARRAVAIRDCSFGRRSRTAKVLSEKGALVGQELDLGSGTNIPAVEWHSESGRFVAAWWDGKVQARVLGATGAPEGASFVVAPGYGTYDGFAMALHPGLGTIASVLHGSTDEDFAAAFSGNGEQSAVLEATVSPSSIGNFNPRVAANALRDEWMLVTSRGFETLALQRLGP